jgi:nucleoside-diphosphate-sugar epimerase
MNSKLLITGANGFLGNYVVGEALRHGHAVRALVRPNTDVTTLAWSNNERVEIARADLRTSAGLTDIVRGVDCVVHLAAAKTGDAAFQYEGTVLTTENLLDAMVEAGVRRLVAISSFSVYDFMRASAHVALDEQSPVETDAFERDAYAQAKLVQEQLIRDHASKDGFDLVVLRPGVIWGKDNLLNAWVGIGLGSRMWVRTGASACVPATYVENCAEAIVLAAGSSAGWGQTFNVVDDALPTQREFLRMALGQLASPPKVIPLPYILLRFAASTANFIDKKVFRGRAHLPSILVPCRLEARARPLTYSNRKLKDLLGWSPRYSLAESFRRAALSEPQQFDDQPSDPVAATSS